MEDARTQLDGKGPEKFTLSRTGDRDIEFTGWFIGADSDEITTGRTLTVEIYATVGGNYIVLEKCTSQWEAPYDKNTNTITIVNYAANLYYDLLDICGGKELGRITQGAWDEAVKTDPDLAPYITDKIE